MQQISTFGNIGGKRIGVVLLFDNYSERDFAEDLNVFHLYQQGKAPNGGEFEKDQKMWGVIKQPQQIPFSYFKEESLRWMSSVIFALLKDNPGMIVSDELNIQFKLMRWRGYSCMTNEEVSDVENWCLWLAGRWIVNNLVAPMFYYKKLDFAHTYKFLAHEFVHMVDIMGKYTTWLSKYEKKIREMGNREVGQKKGTSTIFYLYLSMFNLREEGLAEFIPRVNSGRIDVSLQGAMEYRKNMETLAKMALKRDSRPYYESAIGYENLTRSGENFNGLTMCLFIAMYVAKRMGLPYTITAGSQVYNNSFHPYLDSLLTSHNSIGISNLNPKSIEVAYRYIRPYDHYYFLSLYEKACDDLGIPDQHRVITRRLFFDLVKEAKTLARLERQRRMNKGNFLFILDRD